MSLDAEAARVAGWKPAVQSKGRKSMPAPRASLVTAMVASVLLIVAGCSPSSPTGATSSKPTVFVSLLPQKFFVERIAGDAVTVQALIGPGQSEHVFEPTSQQMMDLAGSKLYFALGSTPERTLLDKMRPNMPNLKVIDTRAGIQLRQMGHDETCVHDEHDHDHDHDHEHAAENGEPDPHIWLDPQLVKVQAGHIARALAALLPDRASDFAANLKRFEGELDALDQRIAAALAPLKGQTLFVYHPSFGYFADRYGLKQIAIEVSGREPSPKEAAEIINRAKASNVHLIITQPQFPTSSAQVIANEIRGAVLSFDPLAADYMENLDRLARELQRTNANGSGSK